ncbi:unnamed protein product [Prorocentrum cordatum]|uniref:Nitrate/nitrite transporter n=1 Tax=Prorocentrum cordatum TaxID=2364126 RepID=A0ABN9PJB9_9DINO|nr:unnamed protein product [Polarella glacialis]
MAGTSASQAFDLPTDDQGKATTLRLLFWGRTKEANPHMRGFWFATISFFWAFVGCFAFAPLMAVVREDIGLCDGFDEKGKCKCGAGTECNKLIGFSGLTAVASTIFVRVLLGGFLEKFGPRKVQVALLSLGALFVASSAAITDATGLIVVRFCIGAVGATFVTNQFWSSILFNRKIVGMTNATAGGWGNLGGGVTQSLMPLIYGMFLNGFGMSKPASWRVSMFVPAAIFSIVAVLMWFFSQDTPCGKFDVTQLGKSKVSPVDYVQCLKDPRVLTMIMQYGACFGTELVMNNRLALHFKDYDWSDGVVLSVAAAGLAASAFGLVNLFARSLGGIFSDVMFARMGVPGRIWAQFLALALEGLWLLLFSHMTAFSAALPCLLLFSLGVQLAEGTSYGIVPFMIPQHLGPVSAMVGAGGNLGAVIATQLFYIQMKVDDDLIPYRVHAGCVLFWALMTVFLYWSDERGSMFTKGMAKNTEVEGAAPSQESAEVVA